MNKDKKITKNPNTLVPTLRVGMHTKAHKNDRQYQFWQEKYHFELIQNGAMMQKKIDYTYHNPVKRGYVKRTEH